MKGFEKISNFYCCFDLYIRDEAKRLINLILQPLLYAQHDKLPKKQIDPEVAQIIQDNIREYFIVYLILCIGVIFFTVFAIRTRKTASLRLPTTEKTAV